MLQLVERTAACLSWTLCIKTSCEVFSCKFNGINQSNIWKTSRSVLSDIKHEAIAGCFWSNKASAASFLELHKNRLNTLICLESLKINVF